MSLSRLSVLLVIIVSEAISQTVSHHSSHPRFTEEEVNEVLRNAASVPPEFGADIRLTIVESGIVEPQMRRALLNEAYSLAGAAQEQVPLKRVDGGGPLTGALNDVFQKGLDYVSLRARVSQAFATDNVDRAQDLFRRIKLRSDVGSACEQQMVYDPSLYYSALARVLESFSTSQRRDRFLEDQVPQLVTAAQIAPFIKVVLEFSNSSPNLAIIAQRIAAQLSEIPSNPRVFSSHYSDAITSLIKLAGLLPKSEQESFLTQVRIWTLASVNGGMCQLRGGQFRTREGQLQRFVMPKPSELFNQQLAAAGLGRVGLDIEANDVSASPLGPQAAKAGYSSEYLRMFRSYHLLATDYGAANTTGRWQSELQKYIDAIDQWKEPSDSDEYSAYYIEKAEILELLLGIQQNATIVQKKMTQAEFAAPRGANSSGTTWDGDDTALERLLKLIDSAPARDVYASQHLLWFHPVKELLRSSYSVGEVDADFVASSDPVIKAYGVLSRLLHSKGSNYN